VAVGQIALAYEDRLNIDRSIERARARRNGIPLNTRYENFKSETAEASKDRRGWPRCVNQSFLENHRFKRTKNAR